MKDIGIRKFKFVAKTQFLCPIFKQKLLVTKGTVNIILMDVSFIGWHVWLTTISFQSLSKNWQKRHPSFLVPSVWCWHCLSFCKYRFIIPILKCLEFRYCMYNANGNDHFLWLLERDKMFLRRRNMKLSTNTGLLCLKYVTTISSWNRHMFKGHFCESDMPLFKRSVTQNGVYSN